MQVKVKKLRPDAILPTYATDGSGCFDLYCPNDSNVAPFAICRDSGFLPDHVAIGTGFAFEVPKDHVMLVFSRSGHGINHGVRLANCTGVIDSDYRGEVIVKLRADTSMSLRIKSGDRIAQALIIPIPRIELIEVDELSNTERGTGGFGSTGK